MAPSRNPTRDRAEGTDCRQPCQAAAAIEPHQECFGLVIHLMSRGQGAEIVFLGPIAQCRVTGLARLFLRIAARNGYAERRVRDAELGTIAGHPVRFIGAFRTQAVIDRCRLYPAGQCRMGEQEQGEAVPAP